MTARIFALSWDTI